MIDTFLPFDLECGFSAALVLVMAQHTHPKAGPQIDNVQTALKVLGTIASRGNAHANLRKLEVEHLAEMLANPRCSYPNADTTACDDNDQANAAAGPSDTQALPRFDTPFFGQWNYDYGLSGNQLMDLVNALEPENFGLIDLE